MRNPIAVFWSWVSEPEPVADPWLRGSRSTSVVVAFVLLLDAAVVGHAGRLSLCVLAGTLLLGVALELFAPRKVKPEKYRLID